MPSTTQELLTQQHRDLESSLQNVLDGNGARDQIERDLGLLRLHIYAEERFLFPALRSDPRPWMSMALARMCEEHGEMWRHIESATALLAADGEMAAVIPAVRELVRLLHIHDLKEEESIYTAADRYQAGPDRPPLAQLFATSSLPAGWRCRNAPA